MKGGFRQSMAWLHAWVGILPGWLLFAVFLTGTIAFFRTEVTFWMQPELHASQPGPETAAMAMERLRTLAPNAESWVVGLPEERSPTLSLSWREPGAPPGRRGLTGTVLDAGSGVELHPRDTAGGNFLYRFHYELYALPRDWGRAIVGIATMAMFVAILSGVITHRRIFKDFFTFRPAKGGQRSWLDGHNAAAVLGLPFHLMITYSGLVLFISTLMPWALDDGGRHGRGGAPPDAETTVEKQLTPADLPEFAPIGPVLAQAEALWGIPAGRIMVEDPAGAAVITLAPRRNTRLSAHSGSGSIGVERLHFDGRSGRLIGRDDNIEESAVQATNNVLGSLHRARFADTTMRWLFFLAGVAGTAMVGTGLILWTVKRAKQQARPDGTIPRHIEVMERLNIAAITGLTIAVGAYFVANRLLPVDMADRAGWEIRVFFAVWAAFILHPFLRPLRVGWVEQLTIAAGLFAAIPLLNMAVTGSHLFVTLPAGSWIVAGFDLICLLTALGLGATALKVAGRWPVAAVRPSGRGARVRRRAVGRVE